MRFCLKVLVYLTLYLISVNTSVSKETEDVVERFRKDIIVKFSDGKQSIESIGEYKSRRTLKVPKAIQRRYRAWSSPPRNASVVFHSIPVEVTQIEDELQLVTSPYRKTNNTIVKVHLWMEFPRITNPKMARFKKYSVDITPVISTRNLTIAGGCEESTFSSKTRFPENELEMRFDITSLYKNCKEVDNAKYFKFKFRFFVPFKTSDIDLDKDYNNMFIIFKEIDNQHDFFGFTSTEVNHNHMTKKFERMLKNPEVSYIGPRIKGSKTCSLERWVLDFDDIGWDNWIYAPPKYEANICNGRCSFPLADHMNATNYAIIKAIASTVFGKPRGACCVANELAPLTMIIKDEETVTLKVQKDMIAKSCACY